MNSLKSKALLFLLISLPFFSFSQFNQVEKIKISKDQFNGQQYAIASNGLAIHYYSKKNLNLEFYNTDLKKSNSFIIPPERGLILLNRQKLHNFSYDSILDKVILFHNFNLSYCDPDGSNNQTNKISIPRKFSFNPEMLTVGDNSFVIAYKLKGFLFEKLDYTTLANVTWQSGKIEPMPLLPNWKKKQMQKLSYVNDKFFSVLYQDNTNRKQKSKNIALFDSHGNLMVKKLITSKAISRPVIDFKIAEFDNSEIIVFGSYGSSVESDYSRGIVIAKQINFKTEYIKHIDLISIKDFYSYLPEKQKLKTEKRVERRKKRGKNIDIVTYSHHPLKVNNTLILTSEFCYPTYRTEQKYVADSKGGHWETVVVFDGYVYTHAVVLGVDSKGEKVFEHVIPINLDFKKFTKVQTLRINIDGNIINYSYAYKGQLYHYSINDGKLEKHELIDIAGKKDNSKKSDLVLSELSYWYDNYYFSTTMVAPKGKNRSKKSQKLKEFFIIKYELKLED